MRLHRFIGSFDLAKERVVLTDPALIHQIARVFRAKAGDHLILCDGEGNEAEVEITSINKTTIEAHVIQHMKNQKEHAKGVVSLYCAIMKKDLFELVVQKAVEAGIDEIHPIVTKRTVKANVRLDRLETIAKEAAEQSGRGKIPLVSDPIPFGDALSGTSGQIRILFHPGHELAPLKKITGTKNVALFIGPEGGFDDEEVSLAQDKGVHLAGLGSFTLRAETAAIIASFLAVHREECF